MLSFFFDADQEAWGFDPAEKGAAAVIYTPAGYETERRAWPADIREAAQFSEVGVSLRVELTASPWEFAEVATLGLTGDAQIAYAEATSPTDDDPRHRLLGHPDPIQGDMQIECELVSHGLFCGDGTGYADPRAAELRPNATEWRLLLQVDSDERSGMAWGDWGRIYYWIRAEAMRAGRWDEARLVLQSP